MDSIFFSPCYFSSATVEEVQTALDHGEPIVATDGSQDTVLHRAAADSHNPEVMELLLKHIQQEHVKIAYSIHVDSPTITFLTPLHEAAQKNWNEKVVEALLKAGADVNVQDKAKQETPLHKAIGLHEELAVVGKLLEYQPDLEARDTQGRTPLHKAASTPSSLEIIDALLQAGARKDAETEDTETPCQIAHGTGAPEEIRNRLCT